MLDANVPGADAALSAAAVKSGKLAEANLLLRLGVD
jgi:hypothetical protein